MCAARWRGLDTCSVRDNNIINFSRMENEEPNNGVTLYNYINFYNYVLVNYRYQVMRAERCFAVLATNG